MRCKYKLSRFQISLYSCHWSGKGSLHSLFSTSLINRLYCWAQSVSSIVMVVSRLIDILSNVQIRHQFWVFLRFDWVGRSQAPPLLTIMLVQMALHAPIEWSFIVWKVQLHGVEDLFLLIWQSLRRWESMCHVRDSIGSAQISYGACHGKYSCATMSGELAYMIWLLMHLTVLINTRSRAYKYIWERMQLWL
jgi:hypothetical protein